MQWWRELKYIFRQLNRRNANRELDDEIRAHMELETEQMIHDGLSAEEAKFAARRAFGSVALSKERSRRMWGLKSAEDLVKDVRYATRMLRRNPVFTGVAVMSLALGIGANTAIFSLIDGVLLKMLPVRHPEQLVLLQWNSGPNMLAGGISGSLNITPDGKKSSTSFSYPTFQYIRDHNSTLTDAIAFAELEQLDVGIDGQAEIATGQLISGNYYTDLGVDTIVGRPITEMDDRASASPVIVISYAYWQRRFGQDPAVIGKTISLNRNPFTIIGVTPARFTGTLDVTSSPDISVPMAFQNQVMSGGPLLADGANWWLQILGRLKPDVTQAQAQNNLDTIFQQNVTADQSLSSGRDTPSLTLTSGSRGLTVEREEYSRPLYMLMGVVGLVLLIACVNVANLLLSRANARQKEIAVRLALGASRRRLIRMLLTESMLLSIIGGAIGLLTAHWSRGLLSRLISLRNTTLAIDMSLDLRVLAFAAGASLLTGLLFGAIPAIRTTNVELTPALKDNTSGRGRSRLSLGKLLVIIQVGLSVVLLIGAGLFVRTLRNLENVDVGFNASNLLVFRINPTFIGYKSTQLSNLYDQMVERIQAIPGVRSVTVSRNSPINGGASITHVSVAGSTPTGKPPYIYVNRVRDNFLDVMGIPLLSGRSFNRQDNEAGQKVAIINEAFARYYFPNENPVGRQFDFESPGDPIEVVGIVKNAKYTSLRDDISPMAVYIPYQQNLRGLGQMSFEVRTAGNPLEMTTAVRQAIQSVDKDVPIFAVKSEVQQIDESIAQERLFATLSSLFGILALLLACIGLYGVMSYSVARRTNEIGIRTALGAQRKDIAWMILRESSVMIVIGIAIGLPAAFAITRFVRSMLFGLTPTDSTTFVVSALIMIVVALGACYIPARRATRVDPLAALRYD